jgi:hypothetical protein
VRFPECLDNRGNGNGGLTMLTAPTKILALIDGSWKQVDECLSYELVGVLGYWHSLGLRVRAGLA